MILTSVIKYSEITKVFAVGAATLITSSAAVYKPALEPGRNPIPGDLPDDLRATVNMLATQIGERNCYRPDNLEAAASWIEGQFAATGLRTRRLPVNVPAGPPYDCGKMTVWNIEAEKPGGKRANEVIIIGAHYDSRVTTPGWRDHKPLLKDRKGTPGANDNASGVAAMLALARMLANVPTERTLRFVAFVNEEPPFFLTDTMGSRVYARSCAEDRSLRVVGMISPETLGCYSPQPRKKRIQAAGLFGLPDRPDYIAFLSDRSSRDFSRECADIFRQHSPMVARTLALPAVCRRVAWSDDWSFLQEGIPAFIVTDTAWLRHDDYHELSDTADRLDYAPMADVVWGLRHVIETLANPDALPDCGTHAPSWDRRSADAGIRLGLRSQSYYGVGDSLLNDRNPSIDGLAQVHFISGFRFKSASSVIESAITIRYPDLGRETTGVQEIWPYFHHDGRTCGYRVVNARGIRSITF